MSLYNNESEQFRGEATITTKDTTHLFFGKNRRLSIILGQNKVVVTQLKLT